MYPVKNKGCTAAKDSYAQNLKNYKEFEKYFAKKQNEYC
jgi:hypothetical protein